jgi:hypothetical protein
MPFVILPTNSASGGYDVTNSLRFNPSSSDYLSRTPAGAGNRKIFTYSTWVKRSGLDVEQTILNCESAGPVSFYFYFKTDGVMELIEYNGGYPVWLRSASRVFRDVSAWYHIVLTYDTTQATDTNRVKIYVNGSQITTDVNTYPSQNYDSQMNRAVETNISRRVLYNAYFFNGYQTEINFIDGTALEPTSFGETDTDTGIWKPKAYTGTYGTNGFYLQFKNSASLGTDSSGNGNTFTVNNLTSIDQTTDTPTNNFCTLNPLNFGAGTLSEGNLKWVGAGNVGNLAFGNIGIDMGVSTQYYWEVLLNASNPTVIGIAPTTLRWNDTTRVGSYSYYSANGNKYSGTSASAYGASFTTNDIVGVLAGNGSITFYKNGSSQGVAFTGLTGTYLPMLAEESCNVSMNFGNPPFAVGTSNTDGAGFGNFEFGTNSGYALNTKNLANFG